MNVQIYQKKAIKRKYILFPNHIQEIILYNYIKLIAYIRFTDKQQVTTAQICQILIVILHLNTMAQ